MHYEVVELAEKTVVGLAARTNNLDPQMGQTIGLLWQRLFGGLYERIAHRADGHTIGLYRWLGGKLYGDGRLHGDQGAGAARGNGGQNHSGGTLCQICRCRRPGGGCRQRLGGNLADAVKTDLYWRF